MTKTALAILILALILIWVLAIGWITMLAIGIIHADVLPAVRPAGFETSMVLGVLFDALVGAAAGSARSSR